MKPTNQPNNQKTNPTFLLFRHNGHPEITSKPPQDWSAYIPQTEYAQALYQEHLASGKTAAEAAAITLNVCK